MKSFFIMAAIILSGLNGLHSQDTNFYSFTVETIDGKEISLEQFKGKKVLVVNVASNVDSQNNMKICKNYMKNMAGTNLLLSDSRPITS